MKKHRWAERNIHIYCYKDKSFNESKVMAYQKLARFGIINFYGCLLFPKYASFTIQFFLTFLLQLNFRINLFGLWIYSNKVFFSLRVSMYAKNIGSLDHLGDSVLLTYLIDLTSINSGSKTVIYFWFIYLLSLDKSTKVYILNLKMYVWIYM